jgi:hypothetical protein
MRITSEILDKTIEMNEQTTKQVEAHIQYIEKRLIKWKSLPVEQQALEILKEYHLVEAPIPDENWGGAIRKFGNGSMIPIINTAQPRLYQYFIYWHEVYHLTEQVELDTHKEKNYEITAEFDLNERKADYFASQMIFRYMDLYDYFHSLRFDDFLVNMAHCMKSFKAPYKAILIELYQIAKKNRNEQLQSQIKHYFDQRLTIKEWSAIFQEYSLDDTLIKPSLVINLSSIKQVIKNAINQHPDVELYKDNLELVREWEEKYKAIQRELKERFDG